MLTSSWEYAGKPMLARLDFLPSLLDFNGDKKDEINGETCELLLPYLNMPEFTFDRARQACGNVAGASTARGRDGATAFLAAIVLVGSPELTPRGVGGWVRGPKTLRVPKIGLKFPAALISPLLSLEKLVSDAGGRAGGGH